MTSEEQRELLMCISTRICFVETGDPVLRAQDVQTRLASAGSSAEERRALAAKLKPLNSYQMRLILMLEGLYTRIAKARTT